MLGLNVLAYSNDMRSVSALVRGSHSQNTNAART
jgi:hypothetical protein